MTRPTLPEEPSDAHSLLMPLDEMPRRRAAPKRLLVRRSFGGFVALGLLAAGGAGGYLLVVAPLREQVLGLREQVRLGNDTTTRQLAQIGELEQQLGEALRAGSSQRGSIGAHGVGVAEVLAWSDALTERIHASEAFGAASDAGLLKVARAESYVDLWLLPGAQTPSGGLLAVVERGLAAALEAVEAAPRPQGWPNLAASIWQLDREGSTYRPRAHTHRAGGKHRPAGAALPTKFASLGALVGRDARSRRSLGELSRWPGFAVPPVRGRDELETTLVRLELEPQNR